MARLSWDRLSPFAALPLSMADADWTATDASAIVVTPWAALGANLYRIVVDATKTGTAIYGRRLRDIDGDLVDVASGPIGTHWSMTWPGTAPAAGSGVSVFAGPSLSADLSTAYQMMGAKAGTAGATWASQRVHSTTNLAGEAAGVLSGDVVLATYPVALARISVASTAQYSGEGHVRLVSAAGVASVPASAWLAASFNLGAGDLYEIVAVRCTGVGGGNETVDVRLGRLTTQTSGYTPPT